MYFKQIIVTIDYSVKIKIKQKTLKTHVTKEVSSTYQNHIGGVMVNMLSSNVVDRGCEPQSCQTKDYKIGICSFSAKHAALRRKSKDWLARNQNNVYKYRYNRCSTSPSQMDW
jgi:hypothetical protein